jgi:hypothetical protein
MLNDAKEEARKVFKERVARQKARNEDSGGMNED